MISNTYKLISDSYLKNRTSLIDINNLIISHDRILNSKIYDIDKIYWLIEDCKKLAERLGDVEIKSQSMDHGFQGWTIDIKGKFSHPTFEDWESLKQISDYIHSSPRMI